MFDQDLSRFAILLVGVGEVYGKSLTSAVIDVYWNVLKAFKFEDVKKAVYLHLENPDAGKFLPKPADIIMAIEGSPQNQALRAWTKVVSAIHGIGVYTSVAFDDALIHAVIEDMGGWRIFCVSETERLPFIGREFQERYRGHVIKKPLRHPKYLTGIAESQNSSSGYAYDPPVLLGDKAKAEQVIATGSRGSIFDARPSTAVILKTSGSIAKITGKT
ncbi:MAG: bacteriophage protein [uncultured bacterium]|nr:MAG: bacteriophage protein [uncultured bacterium]